MSQRKVENWDDFFSLEFKQPYFRELEKFVNHAYKSKICYPPKKEILNAFHITPLKNVKVVIIGQDPYHGPNQANGLCFSVREGIAFPPSLLNIFKELKEDLDIPLPTSGDLTHWAKQGVFLLNSTLTVEAHKAKSHQKEGWEIFTDNVIRLISKERENIIFLLWGGLAKKKVQLINTEKHFILQSGHPSPLSANRGYWFGNKHFSTTNQLLKKMGKQPIQW